jgi:hypothetical protein
MSLFIAAFVLHLLVAIFGVGPVVVMAILGSRAAPTRELAIERRDLLASVSRWVSIALTLMLLSGVLIGIGAGGGQHETGWYRASVLLLVVIGALNGFAQRKLRRSDPVDLLQSIRFVARVSWVMCTMVGVITILMTLRPGWT